VSYDGNDDVLDAAPEDVFRSAEEFSALLDETDSKNKQQVLMCLIVT